TLSNPLPFPAVSGVWYVTANGYRANLSQVNPLFRAAAVSDSWRPNDRWTVNLGVRFENYTFNLPDTVDGYPARAFWFAAYNREFCLVPGVLSPEQNPAFATTSCAAEFGPGATPVNLQNQSSGTQSNSITQPRLGLTYAAGADDVIRGSYGLFARPPDSRDAAYNTVQQDLASFVGTNLVPYGYFTPQKPIYPDKSWNGDLSWEHHFKDTSVSFKLTPFYRSTENQLQQFILNPLTGLFGSINDGHQTSEGVEFALSAGNFNADGWSGQLAYTYTHSQIVYTDFINGHNVIDNINTYITQYNQYTSACAGLATVQCSPNGQPNTLSFQCFHTTGVGYNGPCAVGDITNPYYALAAQPLLNRSAAYTTYDLIPSPFAAANGYATPEVASLIVQYKKGPLTVVPSMTFSSGASYGSPLSVPGYAPNSCTAAQAGTNAANTTSCGGFVFIPDPYTNQFDNLGAFKQPSRFTLNVQLGYQVTQAIKATLTMTGIVDQCNQRGYVWDYPTTCVYSSLPSSILPPSGNFLTPAATPIQLKYPYAMWLNNNNTGAVGVKNPFQAAFTVEFKPRI
ncbi:MAG: TonB-dependent receptor, partial [Candidatus Eremiobacteraeota bacterium]|nr:TonB-dependent receptor [Candidatus Eremiobacteraeota bacterium]